MDAISWNSIFLASDDVCLQIQSPLENQSSFESNLEIFL